MNTSDWARQNGTAYKWSAALTNHEPASRDWASGLLYRYGRIDETRGPGIILEGARHLKDNLQSNYLIDDGRTVEVFYVTGWSPGADTIFLQPFPTNYENGERRLTSYGEPVSFEGWHLGPRRTYHLKVSLAN